MANTDRARKLLVRTALVTSTTITTLVGAQSFALLDARQFLPTETPAQNDVAVQPEANTRTPMPITRTAPEITILHTAPSITIMRQSGQVNTSTVQPSVNTVQPPVASQISVPRPIVVQRPFPVRTRSSR